VRFENRRAFGDRFRDVIFLEHFALTSLLTPSPSSFWALFMGIGIGILGAAGFR